ncbi:MAG: hypothetical protein DRI48_10345, partial [Chloroflexi bacterium]
MEPKILKVLKLEPKQPVPEGRVEIVWRTPPHAGRYAVLPKPGCSLCAGRAGRIIIHHNGVPKAIACECVLRRLRLHWQAEARTPTHVAVTRDGGARSGQLRQAITTLERSIEAATERMHDALRDQRADVDALHAELICVQDEIAGLRVLLSETESEAKKLQRRLD